MEPPPKEGQTEAAFNAAVATLMRLDKILTDIKNISLRIGIDISNGQGQHLKYRLIKDFYTRAIPLLKDETAKEKIKEMMASVSPIWVKRHPEWDWGVKPHFSDELENKLDELLILIQTKLQDEGYFMPEKREDGL